MTKTLNYERAIAEAYSVAKRLWQPMDDARIAYEKAQLAYQAEWDDAFKIAKKADRNYDD